MKIYYLDRQSISRSMDCVVNDISSPLSIAVMLARAISSVISRRQSKSEPLTPTILEMAFRDVMNAHEETAKLLLDKPGYDWTLGFQLGHANLAESLAQHFTLGSLHQALKICKQSNNKEVMLGNADCPVAGTKITQGIKFREDPSWYDLATVKQYMLNGEGKWLHKSPTTTLFWHEIEAVHFSEDSQDFRDVFYFIHHVVDLLSQLTTPEVQNWYNSYLNNNYVANIFAWAPTPLQPGERPPVIERLCGDGIEGIGQIDEARVFRIISQDLIDQKNKAKLVEQRRKQAAAQEGQPGCMDSFLSLFGSRARSKVHPQTDILPAGRYTPQ